MLIKIDKSLVENMQGNPEYEEILITLEYLAIARREGKHAVIAEPETFKEILKCRHLSLHCREVYKKISYKAPYINTYISAVSLYVEVIDDCLEPTLKKISSEKEVIQVSYKFFNDSEKIQKTILLCENLNDGEFYKKIAEVYLKKKNIPSFIKVDYECRGGGGGTIANEYENIQKSNKRWCLCLADSDKIAPEASLGGTAKRLKDDKKIVTTHLDILKVREIENLIPRKILSEVSSGDTNREDAFKKLDFLFKIEPNILRFLDIKEGTLLQKIVKDNSDQVKSYWENILSQIPNNPKSFDLWCQENWRCEQQEKRAKNCKCYISKGFGDEIMNTTIEWLEKKGRSPQEIAKMAKMIEPYLESDWDELGQMILNWCIINVSLPFPV